VRWRAIDVFSVDFVYGRARIDGHDGNLPLGRVAAHRQCQRFHLSVLFVPRPEENGRFHGLVRLLSRAMLYPAPEPSQ
jgi:hypothetical protein